LSKKHLPAALVTEKLILCIQRLCGTKILQAACNGTVLFNIKAQVKKRFISCCHSLTLQAPCLVGKYSLMYIHTRNDENSTLKEEKKKENSITIQQCMCEELKYKFTLRSFNYINDSQHRKCQI
jgi:hypothetical protein